MMNEPLLGVVPVKLRSHGYNPWSFVSGDHHDDLSTVLYGERGTSKLITSLGK